jgi:hypothetical protein
MTQTSPAHRSGTILEQIREGMQVVDSQEKEVGKVKSVFFGAMADQPDYEGVGAATNQGSSPELYPSDTLTSAIAEAFTGSDQVPEEVRSRLIHSGFIRIDRAGLFSRDAFVMPDQIASVSEDLVYLSVTKDHLLKD